MIVSSVQDDITEIDSKPSTKMFSVSKRMCVYNECGELVALKRVMGEGEGVEEEEASVCVCGGTRVTNEGNGVIELRQEWWAPKRVLSEEPNATG